MLDDERLTANHSEAHLMMRALQRGGGGWFSTPETQVFYDRPDWLAWLHGWTVAEMARRNYPSGLSHATPAEFTPNLHGLMDNFVSAAPGYKNTSDEWYKRDYADLYQKWTKERRWDENGNALLGRRKLCNPLAEGPDPTYTGCYVGLDDCLHYTEKRGWNRRKHVPQPHKWKLLPAMVPRVQQSWLKHYDDLVGPRELIEYDKSLLSKLTATRRKY